MPTSTLTYQEMIAQRDALDNQIRALESKRNEALVSICRVINEYGLSLDEIRARLGSSEERVSSEPKTEPQQALETATAQAPTPTKETQVQKAPARKAALRVAKSPKKKTGNPKAPAARAKKVQTMDAPVTQSPEPAPALSRHIPTGAEQSAGAAPVAAQEAQPQGKSLTPNIPTAKDNDANTGGGPRFYNH